MPMFVGAQWKVSILLCGIGNKKKADLYKESSSITKLLEQISGGQWFLGNCLFFSLSGAGGGRNEGTAVSWLICSETIPESHLSLVLTILSKRGRENEGKRYVPRVGSVVLWMELFMNAKRFFRASPARGAIYIYISKIIHMLYIVHCSCSRKHICSRFIVRVYSRLSPHAALVLLRFSGSCFFFLTPWNLSRSSLVPLKICATRKPLWMRSRKEKRNAKQNPTS